MQQNKTFPELAPPVAQKRPVTDTRHGIVRTDDYAWLRADNWQEVFRDPSLLDPAIRAHLEAENAYQQTMLEDTAELRKQLFAEMKGRIKEDDSSVPLRDGRFAYGTSFVTGGEQPRYFRVPAAAGGPQEVLLDGDREAEGKAYFRLGGADHSHDHRRLIWGFDDKGSEFYTLKVRDLGTRRRSGRRDRRHRWRGRVGRRQRGLLLHEARRQPPPLEDFLPPSRSNGSKIRWSTRRPIPASS